MANQTVYPYGTNGSLPDSVGIINDFTTGGADKALSAEAGKTLYNDTRVLKTIALGPLVTTSRVGRDGSFKSSNVHRRTGYIDISQYSELLLTTTLQISTSPAVQRQYDSVVALYDEEKTLVRIIDPLNYSSGAYDTTVPLVDFKITRGASEKYIAISYCFSDGGDLSLSAIKSIREGNNVITRLRPIQKMSYYSSSRLFAYFEITRPCKFTAIPKEGNQLALRLGTVADSSYAGNSSYSDSGFQDSFVDYDLNFANKFYAQIRVSGTGFSDKDYDISDLFEDIYVEYSDSVAGAEIPSVEYLNFKASANNQKYVDYDSIVRSINHTGYTRSAPENTIPAYILSAQQGFKYVETDIRFTSDDVPVLIHDPSINRTARNADGTELENTINISDITYEQALEYDFGIWRSADYAGTKIPSLAEFCETCRNYGLRPYVELKTGSQAQIESVVDIVDSYGLRDKATYISVSETLLGYVKNYSPSSRLGYVSSSALSSAGVTIINNLKTALNEVFFDSSNLTDASIALAKTNKIPYEVWTIDSTAGIVALDPYITGVTSNYYIAGKIIYKG